MIIIIQANKETKMKRFPLFFTLLFSLLLLNAGETNTSSGTDDQNLTKKNLQEQLEREKRYAKEQKFYQGKDYNLSEHKVDPKLVEKVPVIEPDYDFDITDVYRDDDENVTY